MNARAVCPEGASITEPPVTTGALITSNPLAVGGNGGGGRPSPTGESGGGGNGISRPSKPVPDTSFGGNDEDLDVFPGDFSAAIHNFLNNKKPNQRPSGPAAEFACGSVVVSSSGLYYCT